MQKEEAGKRGGKKRTRAAEEPPRTFLTRYGATQYTASSAMNVDSELDAVSSHAFATQRDMCELFRELTRYRDRHPLFPNIKDRIDQCELLKPQIPCRQKTLQKGIIKSLYRSTLGGVSSATAGVALHSAADYGMLSLRSCHCLQMHIAQLLSAADAVDESEFQNLRALQNRMGEQDPKQFSKQDFLLLSQWGQQVGPRPRGSSFKPNRVKYALQLQLRFLFLRSGTCY